MLIGVLEEPLNLLAADGETLAAALSLLGLGLKNSYLPLDEDSTIEGDPLFLCGLGDIMYLNESFLFLIYELLFNIGITFNPCSGESRFLFSF